MSAVVRVPETVSTISIRRCVSKLCDIQYSVLSIMFQNAGRSVISFSAWRLWQALQVNLLRATESSWSV